MPALRILMLARPNLLTDPGGDTTQVFSTARALRRRGHLVDINPRRPEYQLYDLLHFFNIIRPQDIIGHLERSDKPYVVSTIYVQYEEYDRHHRRDAVGWASRFLPADSVEYLKVAGKWLLKGEPLSSHSFLWRGRRRLIRHILKGAGCLLPNSLSEYRRLLAHYGIENDYVVAPNGIDPRLFHYKGEGPGNRSGILCVGRIEGRKNQLNLIRSMRGISLPLIIAGRPAPNQKAYYEQCRKAAGPGVRFIGFLPQQSLLQYYLRARVHVLPSWFETTGLSSLEAAAMGCNIVVGDRGDVREYFREDAWYCDPGNPDSIRRAVLEAHQAPQNITLAERVRAEYNWDKASDQTLKGYRTALLKKRPN